MVQLSDYQMSQSFDGQVTFGSQTSPEDLNNLNKALSAGSITGRDTTNLTTASGAPLKVESLEKTLKIVTFNDQSMTFWKNIPKTAAFNTVEEYNQLTGYGSSNGSFNNEGELPVEEDSTYVRRAQLVKFLGVTKSVTHPMSLVSTMIGNAIEREAKNGTLKILRDLDRSLFYGDSTLVPQQFNGLLAQHAQNDTFLTVQSYLSSAQVVDMRGAVLTEAAIEIGANSIVEAFGLGTMLYAPPKVLSDFVKVFYGNKFIQPNTPALTDGVIGQRVKSFESQFGNIGLAHDVFFNQDPSKSSTSASTSQNAPTAPTAVSVTAVASDPLAKYVASDVGNYFYAVTAINRYGESAITVLNPVAAVAVVAGGAVDLNFTPNASLTSGTAFKIYRSQKNAATAVASTFYPIFTISIAQQSSGYDGGATGIVRDRNNFLTNTNQALLVQHDTDVLEFKQLAPLMKMDLAVVSPAYRFMVLLYGTPFLYAPAKMVRFINIGLGTF
jgi:hypothetical protein